MSSKWIEAGEPRHPELSPNHYFKCGILSINMTSRVMQHFFSLITYVYQLLECEKLLQAVQPHSHGPTHEIDAYI